MKPLVASANGQQRASMMINQNNVLKAHYIKSDKIMLMINYSLVLYALLLSSWYNTWAEALIIGLTTAVALTSIFLLIKGSLISRIAMATGFMVMTSLHIHQSHGMIEVHFGVFVLLAILLYYKDWLPITIAASITLTQHLLFFYWQTNGSQVWLLQSTDNGWWVIFMHAGYVVAESALLIWFSLNLKKDYLQSKEMILLTDNIISEKHIDLTLRSSGNTVLLQRFDGFTIEIEQLAQQVHSAAEKLSSNGKSLAQVTEKMEFSSQVQERETGLIASAVTEISHIVQDISQHADTAAESADKMNNNAAEATTVSHHTQELIKRLSVQVHQASETIESLHEQSKGIGSVLEVIRAVAEQTNLLALNAAIEAARAGEQGRGFAVVADEVRTLAQKAQEATEKIDSMITTLQMGSESAVADIKSSKELADDCVENTEGSLSLMEQTSETISKINGMNARIAKASSEQTRMIDEISSNLNNILEASHGAASDSKEAARSGALLLELSQSLKILTKRFKVS
ncbi:MAG: methyl-accepting chemotaxis protein [Cellvibrionaceae bacterium]